MLRSPVMPPIPAHTTCLIACSRTAYNKVLNYKLKQDNKILFLLLQIADLLYFEYNAVIPLSFYAVYMSTCWTGSSKGHSTV